MRTDQINVILLIALISWGTAQIIKTFIHFIKTKSFKAERLTGAGGMPSAHSATVCATAITTCYGCQTLGGASGKGDQPFKACGK